MKGFGPPGLTLIGFKARESLDPALNLSPAVFVYPDELETRGSICIFSALLKVMLEMQSVALCCYIPRSYASPRLVILTPQAESLDDRSLQIDPPGFYLINLPYSDDIRTLSIPEVETRPGEEAVEVLASVIDKLTLRGGFDPLQYENPALQKYYAGLRALALDQETVDTVLDCTLPNVEAMRNRSGELLARARQLLPQPAGCAERRGSEATRLERGSPANSSP